jgi:transcriptional regulator with XRE-family HTH domain
MSEVRAAARYLAKHHGYSLTSLARATGLHRNSLLRLPDKSWTPKSETLRRLEKLIVRAEAKRRGEMFQGETLKRGGAAKR